MDSNHRNPKMTDLQSVAFNHSATYPKTLSSICDEVLLCQGVFTVIRQAVSSSGKATHRGWTDYLSGA